MDRFEDTRKAKAIVTNAGGVFVSHNMLTGETSYFKRVAQESDCVARKPVTERVI